VTPAPTEYLKKGVEMKPQPKPDLLNLRVWLLLVIVGAALGLIGWYRFFQ
jgi:hypothetical protein